MLQLCSVLFLCGLLKICGLLIFFLLLISLMDGHAAIMWCAIFVRSAKIERFAEYFCQLLISPMFRHAAIIGYVKKNIYISNFPIGHIKYNECIMFLVSMALL